MTRDADFGASGYIKRISIYGSALQLRKRQEMPARAGVYPSVSTISPAARISLVLQIHNATDLLFSLREIGASDRFAHALSPPCHTV